MGNLKEERLKILELLKEGTITPDQASSLLDALSDENKVTQKEKQQKPVFRMLKIKVDSVAGEKVRVNIPIEFAKLLKSGKFGNLNLNSMNVDVDALLEMIEHGVTGELVSIEDVDGSSVVITVE